MEVTPSILVDNIDEFWKQVRRLAPYFPHSQVDIVDNILVPGKTIDIDDIIKTITDYRQLITDYRIVFDFHLMVKDYKKEIKKLEKLRNSVKIDVVFVHHAARPNFEFLISQYQFSFGLVLNPEDRVKAIVQKYDVDKLPAIQIMSVHPGAQGQAFIPEVLKKIEQLRSAGYRNKIYLDGGINEQSLPIIVSQSFPPDAIGPGSFFSKAENLEVKISYLKNLGIML